MYYVCTYMYPVNMHTYVCTHIHTYIHTYIHTCLYVCVRPQGLQAIKCFATIIMIIISHIILIIKPWGPKSFVLNALELKLTYFDNLL